jgi:hypothetical protein
MNQIEENRIETNPVAGTVGEFSSDISSSPSDIEIALRGLEAPWRARNEARDAMMSAEATYDKLRPWLPRELYMQPGEHFFKSTDAGYPIFNDDVIEPLRARLRSSGVPRKRLREIVDAYDAWKTKVDRISELAGLAACEKIYDARSREFFLEVSRIRSMQATSVRDAAIQVFCYALDLQLEDRSALQMVERLAELAGVETEISLPWEMCDPEPAGNRDSEGSLEQ